MAFADAYRRAVSELDDQLARRASAQTVGEISWYSGGHPTEPVSVYGSGSEYQVLGYSQGYGDQVDGGGFDWGGWAGDQARKIGEGVADWLVGEISGNDNPDGRPDASGRADPVRIVFPDNFMQGQNLTLLAVLALAGFLIIRGVT